MHHNSHLDISAEELSLPPIMRPLLYEDFRNQLMQKERNNPQGKQLKNAELNLKETLQRYPETKNMLNMRFKDLYIDPFEKEPHNPSRKIMPESKMVSQLDHNYSKKIKS
mmetsp:Transcript_26671/g.25695  ORF Transcript_26671/g.25695 Transcript_26671/m.25695 type:complete len:110 (-) Transcript_26671:34-363(-)